MIFIKKGRSNRPFTSIAAAPFDNNTSTKSSYLHFKSAALYSALSAWYLATCYKYIGEKPKRHQKNLEKMMTFYNGLDVQVK